jgi:hypothetical protein
LFKIKNKQKQPKQHVIFRGKTKGVLFLLLRNEANQRDNGVFVIIHLFPNENDYSDVDSNDV